MRETRQSGSEGGARFNPFVPTPIRQSIRRSGWQGMRVVDTEISRRTDVLRLGLRPQTRSAEKRR